MEFLFLYLIGGLFSFVYYLLSYKIQYKKVDSDAVAIATLSIYTSILSLLFMISSDITTYGSTSGTTFKVPDLRGEFIRGFDAGRGVDSGRNV
jgi:phage-related tail fiber protein